MYRKDALMKLILNVHVHYRYNTLQTKLCDLLKIQYEEKLTAD